MNTEVGARAVSEGGGGEGQEGWVGELGEGEGDALRVGRLAKGTVMFRGWRVARGSDEVL